MLFGLTSGSWVLCIASTQVKVAVWYVSGHSRLPPSLYNGRDLRHIPTPLKQLSAVLMQGDTAV